MSKFGINPGPLKLTGPRVKADPFAGQCKAISKRTGWRCWHDAKDARGLCGLHMRYPPDDCAR